jgi:eukaryotic-like serine/threonine-protein kinase
VIEEDGPIGEPRPGSIVGDRYRVVRPLGQGGTGSVFLAEHVRMGKHFALKVLHPEVAYFEEAVRRFEQEALATGRVDHPHLVSATDFGELPDGSFYLVLEYVEGRSLSEILSAGPLPVRRVVELARQLAEALDAVHAAGIVHRDVKPDNVMVVDRAGEDFVKLFDFGLAKVKKPLEPVPSPAQAGVLIGTPRYVSPEQAAGRPVDGRSDLYALGVVIYAMLTGAPPFCADDAADILRMHQEQPPPPLPPEIDPGLAALVARLLAKDPRERVQTAREVAGILAELGSEARPHRRTRRRVIGALSIAVGALVLVMGTFAVRSLTRAPPQAPQAPGPDIALERLLAQAEVGDAAAWQALEKRPDGARGVREWLVLGLARAAGGARLPAAEAFRKAMAGDPDAGRDPRLIRAVSAAIEDAQAWRPALQLAADLPGSEGPDLLFRAWASTPLVTEKTSHARALLDREDVRRRVSPALAVALELRDAETCDARQALLPRIVNLGDARSRLPLQRMKNRTGCAPEGAEDCHACLRDDELLDRALESVTERAAPTFTAPRAN